jgi:nicotinate-nucleotide pyrophosphorylase (carboxylating)
MGGQPYKIEQARLAETTMYTMNPTDLESAIKSNVANALAEDIGTGDISAALIPAERIASAQILFRQSAVLCGQAWVNEVFRQLDPAVVLHWNFSDGERIDPNSVVVKISGNARSLLSGERAALNFLQMLSATATRTAYFVDQVQGTGVHLLDTRKTLPCLRLAQKYAVRCGGGENHRMGLYDAFLIKENHIAACGSIAAAVKAARALAPNKVIEIEVETLDELDQALAAGAPMILLDNFSLADTREAVKRTAGRAKLEASGGINDDTLKVTAETGIDYISMGTLTKDLRSIDLSMRLSIGS